ncbi:hypothetical protein E1176_08750 [Fulvivirga sp. RKSG066]|nr:hypothetical protein [Fulvivirga aurantia]
MKYTVLLAILCSIPFYHYGQSQSIKEDLVEEVQNLMIDHYIFLDKATESNQHLSNLMKAGTFESYRDPVHFAKALSKELQKITKDKHLNIVPPPPPPSDSTVSETDFITRHLQNISRFRMGGFGKIELLEGNVGYIELNGFRKEDIPKVDEVMSFFNTADALIIDLRKNGGGNSLGLYLSSYFLEDDVALSGVYERRTDTYRELHTTNVKGEKRLKMPLYVLTSHFTFSAAEAFSYDLQARGRAIVVGEQTGGGAHPVNFMRLPHGYGVMMPYARSINPITQTNWEGVGVKPDVSCPKNVALEKALSFASEEAKQYREAPFFELKDILNQDHISETDQNSIYTILKLILSRKHFEDFMINDLGYAYIDNGQLNAASAVFKANTEIFPDNPNVHDSYAEVLALKGSKEEAMKQYKLAVELATAQKDKKLAIYRENMHKFEGSFK